jgi:hypothetical protein
MAGVVGKTRPGERDADRAGLTADPTPAPGKATLTGALAPASVTERARAEVGAAFGPRAQAVEYAVGEGAAEARGANALTTAGKVDFAPGKFDLTSLAGRARLGEETAHALQQTNPGPPATVQALEGEAKRAGLDFAEGRAPKAALAAPPGVGLADDPKAPVAPDPKDTDPSREVPDLQHGEVVAIKAALANPPEAARLMLKALQRIDAAQFAATDLTDSKLQTGGGTSTTQGPAFQAWLVTYLDGVAAKAGKDRSKLTQAEVKQAIHDAAPPADKKDIQVTMGKAHFASASLLYSSVRHEFVHVQQLRADYLTQIPTLVMPSDVHAPDAGSLGKDREVEAYLWEMEHLAGTGLNDPSELKLLWKECSNAFLNASATANAKLGARFKAAFKDVWAKAMDGHIAAIAGHHAAWKKSGTVADPAAVERLGDDMDMMWRNKAEFDNPWTAHTARHATALGQVNELVAAINLDRFTKLLDVVDKELVAGYADSDDAFARWGKLTEAWNALDAAGKAAAQVRYDKTAPVLWEKTFDALEAEIRKRLKDGEVDVAEETLNLSVGDLFTKAAKSVKTATFAARRSALQAEITKAKQAKKP